jgi:hypothetical protein
MENIIKTIDDENSARPEVKRKKHNSALLAVAKARSEAIHKAGTSFSDGLHPIGTNITYKKRWGVL